MGIILFPPDTRARAFHDSLLDFTRTKNAFEASASNSFERKGQDVKTTLLEHQFYREYFRVIQKKKKKKKKEWPSTGVVGAVRRDTRRAGSRRLCRRAEGK